MSMFVHERCASMEHAFHSARDKGGAKRHCTTLAMHNEYKAKVSSLPRVPDRTVQTQKLPKPTVRESSMPSNAKLHDSTARTLAMLKTRPDERHLKPRPDERHFKTKPDERHF
ncbi:hypothetical protein PMIN04_007944 [Paraphaeosphaeria minitans]